MEVSIDAMFIPACKDAMVSSNIPAAQARIDGNALYYDILVHLFRLIYDIEYEYFKGENIDEITVVNNKYAGLPRVCKLWHKACIAAGLTGIYYDFPALKVDKTDLYVWHTVINKYNMLVYNNKDGELGINIYVGNSKKYFLSVHAQHNPILRLELMSDDVTRDSLSMTDTIAVCKKLRAIFGDKSYLASGLMTWPLGQGVPNCSKFRTELKAWLCTIKVAGKAFIVD